MSNAQATFASLVLVLISAALGELLDRTAAIVVLFLGLIVLIGPSATTFLAGVGLRLRLRFFPPMPASATIQVLPPSLQTRPVGRGTDRALVQVDTFDSQGMRMPNARVILITNNGMFDNGLRVYDARTAPRGDGEGPTGRLNMHLIVAEPAGKPGLATVSAVIPRKSDSLVREAEVIVIGPVAATGLTLTITPNELECGETVLAKIAAVDVNGFPVGDGTVVFFAIDDESVIFRRVDPNGLSVVTNKGHASILIQSPTKPGQHSLVAYTTSKDVNGDLRAAVVTASTFKCLPRLPGGQAD